MRIGKLTSSELQKYVFDKTVAKNPEILQSAGLAEDCAALRTPKILLLTTDPITATGNNAGRLAITVSANDVAVSGGTPLCCLLTIIAPTTASAEDVGKFMWISVHRRTETAVRRRRFAPSVKLQSWQNPAIRFWLHPAFTGKM